MGEKQRSRRRVSAAAALVAVFGTAFGIGLAGDPHSFDAGRVLLIGVLVLGAAVGTLLLIRHLHGSSGASAPRGGSALRPFPATADAATRRAVLRALRNGETDDPHVNELARHVVASNRRLRWLPPTLVALGALLAVPIFFTDPNGWKITRSVASVVLALVLAVALHVRNRRLAAYRGLQPPLR